MKPDKPEYLEVLSNPMLLFNSNRTADRVMLAGHKLGDVIETLPIDEISMAEPDSYPTSEIFAEDGSVIGTVTHFDISLEEKIEVAHKTGGWLSYDPRFTCRVSNQKIDSFYFCTDYLATFDCLKDKKITLSLLGDNVKRISRYEVDEGTWVVESLHPQRLISVIWDDLGDGLMAISLGTIVKERLK